jgi:hypothetical protein
MIPKFTSFIQTAAKNAASNIMENGLKHEQRQLTRLGSELGQPWLFDMIPSGNKVFKPTQAQVLELDSGSVHLLDQIAKNAKSAESIPYQRPTTEGIGLGIADGSDGLPLDLPTPGTEIRRIKLNG